MILCMCMVDIACMAIVNTLHIILNCTCNNRLCESHLIKGFRNKFHNYRRNVYASLYYHTDVL